VVAYGLISYCYTMEQIKLVRVPYNFGKPQKELEWSAYGRRGTYGRTPTSTFMYNESLVTTPCQEITISVIFTPLCSSDDYRLRNPEECKSGVNPEEIMLVDLCKKGKVTPPNDEVTDMSSIHLKSEFTFLTDRGARCRLGKYRMKASAPVFVVGESIAKGQWKRSGNEEKIDSSAAKTVIFGNDIFYSETTLLLYGFFAWCCIGPTFCIIGCIVACTSSPPQPIVDVRPLSGGLAESQMQTFSSQQS